MIREKVTWYLKALPKALRQRLVPLPEAVTAFLEAMPFGRDALPDALRGYVGTRLGLRTEDLPPSTWDNAELPAHLVCNILVVDAAGKEQAEGRDLAKLRAQLGEAAQLSFAQAGPAFSRRGIRSWDIGDLPETLTSVKGGQRITGYPALADDGDSVSLALCDTRDAAIKAMRAGVIRLLRIALKDAFGRFERAADRVGRPDSQRQRCS
jgi:ATP-dependent helicase HrpA